MTAIIYSTRWGDLTLAELVVLGKPVIFRVGVWWYHPHDVEGEGSQPIIEMAAIEFDDDYQEFPAVRFIARDGEKTPWYDQRAWNWFQPK